MKALDQILRGDVDDLDIVGSVDHQIRHGLAHADTGDLRDDIVEALDMLDIQGRIDVYAQRQEFQHIEIALRMTAAGRVVWASSSTRTRSGRRSMMASRSISSSACPR